MLEPRLGMCLDEGGLMLDRDLCLQHDSIGHAPITS